MVQSENESAVASAQASQPPSPGLGAVTAVAFDCFGTLVDFGEQHFVDLMGAIALRYELGLEGKALWDRWLAISKQVWKEYGRDPDRPTAGEEPRFGTYDEIWTEQFVRAFAEAEKEGDANDAYRLMVEHLREAVPFPEVREVVEALRLRYRLCVLSNADDDWLYPCLERANLDFELVVSSERARCYKPRAKIFHHTVELLGLRPENVLYVGDSLVADVLGARHAGLPVAWVNRYGAKLTEKTPPPDLEIVDLRGLLPVLLDGRVAVSSDGRSL